VTQLVPLASAAPLPSSPPPADRGEPFQHLLGLPRRVGAVKVSSLITLSSGKSPVGGAVVLGIQVLSLYGFPPNGVND
jgi:hypothetical protein